MPSFRKSDCTCTAMVVFGGSYVDATHNFKSGIVTVEIFHKSQLTYMDVEGDNRGEREAMVFVDNLAKTVALDIQQNGGLEDAASSHVFA